MSYAFSQGTLVNMDSPTVNMEFDMQLSARA